MMILDILSMVAYGIFIFLGMRLIVMVGAVTRLLDKMGDLHQITKAMVDAQKDDDQPVIPDDWLNKYRMRN